jgi:hypothetical protein
LIDGSADGVATLGGAVVLVLVSPVVASGVGIGPGLLGSATVVPLKATVMAPIASTPAAPAVAEINFNLVVFTDHSNSVRKREGAYFNPFAVRLTEASEGQT